MHFKVHGQGRDLFGDGIALWYVRDRLHLGKSELGKSLIKY